jgi:small basic protein
MGGGAWPFLVGGVICLVNSVNERDLNLLNSGRNIAIKASLGEVLGELRGFLRALLRGVGFISGFTS